MLKFVFFTSVLYTGSFRIRTDTQGQRDRQTDRHIKTDRPTDSNYAALTSLKIVPQTFARQTTWDR